MVFVDVDDLKQSHERSQQEQKLITAISERGQDLLVIVLDREGRVLQFNRAAQEVTGFSLEEVKDKRLWEFSTNPGRTWPGKERLRGSTQGRAGAGRNSLVDETRRATVDCLVKYG